MARVLLIRTARQGDYMTDEELERQDKQGRDGSSCSSAPSRSALSSRLSEPRHRRR